MSNKLKIDKTYKKDMNDGTQQRSIVKIKNHLNIHTLKMKDPDLENEWMILQI